VPDTTLIVPLNGKTADDAVILLRRHWDRLAVQIVSVLRQFHERMPDEQGPDAARLRRMAAPLLAEGVWRALIDALVAEGRVVRSGAWLHLPEHTVSLDASEDALAATLLPLIAQGRFDPPWVRDLASATQAPEDKVRQLLRKLARRGAVYQVVRDLFYHPDTVRELAGLVASLALEQGGVLGASAFRDASGLGRKRAIQILEFFDRVGYTRFQRDLRFVRADSRLLEGL
jgi:selenocysteine-specific elongation factor